MIRTILAAAAVAVGVTAVMAQSDPISQRKALMKENGQHAAAASKMVKGEEPFDVVKVNAAFAHWTETAQKLLALAKPRGDEPVAKAAAVFRARAPAAHRIVSEISNTRNESTSGFHDAAQMTIPPRS